MQTYRILEGVTRQCPKCGLGIPPFDENVEHMKTQHQLVPEGPSKANIPLVSGGFASVRAAHFVSYK